MTKTLLFFLLFLPTLAQAQPWTFNTGAVSGKISVTSSSVGQAVGASEGAALVRRGMRVAVKSGAAVPVCFVYVDSNVLCSTITDPDATGLCVTAGNAYIFATPEEGWSGKVCAILQSGSTAVSVGYNSW